MMRSRPAASSSSIVNLEDKPSYPYPRHIAKLPQVVGQRSQLLSDPFTLSSRTTRQLPFVSTELLHLATAVRFTAPFKLANKFLVF